MACDYANDAAEVLPLGKNQKRYSTVACTVRGAP
jgi:hypothetical protein